MCCIGSNSSSSISSSSSMKIPFLTLGILYNVFIGSINSRVQVDIDMIFMICSLEAK